ncbi:MAG: glycerol-3-phosphate dehydrogenase [Burkholderiales bacterium]|nr:glycerol-3-phosphate dehydrogenase [Burkholderiales bacterium]
MAQTDLFDLLIIGGGINGAGIARDAAGRGLRVALCEQSDLAAATSSASSKLIHGGLRYLEQYEFRLVSEALSERERLLAIAPHLITPLTFVLPWMPGMRPRWMLRLGLWLYDHLARRTVLPASRAVQLADSPLGAGLKGGIKRGFSYSDCWVDDARLVVLNCVDAARRGATICTRTRVLGAARDAGCWRVATSGPNGRGEFVARTLINAAGPWVRNVLAKVTGAEPEHRIRLVKGSHIVTRRLHDGDHAFILQNDDGRVILVLPYRGRYSLIGTTDIAHSGKPEEAIISAEEIAYLCAAVNRYFRQQIGSSDVLWSFSGVRPLYDDGSANPSEVTRDYKLVVDERERAPLLSIYGGKITTYRRLAEQALQRLRAWFPQLGPEWTARVPLPGGDHKGGLVAMSAALAADYPQLPRALLEALARRYGMDARQLLGDATTLADLGAHFGESLYAREVDYLVTHEWAISADDILWRRTKAGLSLDDNSQQALARYMTARGRSLEHSVRVP